MQLASSRHCMGRSRTAATRMIETMTGEGWKKLLEYGELRGRGDKDAEIERRAAALIVAHAQNSIQERGIWVLDD